MSLNKSATIARIIEKLEKLHQQQGTRPGWTGLVKMAFIQLAAEQGYKVCTALSEEAKLNLTEDELDCVEWGEWLYDLVWYNSVLDELTGVERTLSIPLVVECEWDASLHSLALDFDKLLIANADLRVMVCSAYSAFPKDEIISFCKRAVAGYTQGRHGDSFWVCVFHPTEPLHCEMIVKGVNDR